MQYLKKMSAASMSAIPKGYKKDMEHGDTKAIFNVIGIADGFEVGESSMGEWTAFDGTFQASTLATDKPEIFRSKKLFLPDIARDMLVDALQGVEGGKVEFALEIGIRRVVKKNAQGEETGAGYEYTVEPLVEIDTASDPLAGLLSKVGTLALAAPTDETVADTKGKKGK